MSFIRLRKVSDADLQLMYKGVPLEAIRTCHILTQVPKQTSNIRVQLIHLKTDIPQVCLTDLL